MSGPGESPQHHVHPLSPRGLQVRIRGHHWLWPVVVVRDIWLSAVESPVAIRSNLKLLGVASVVLSTPDIASGAVQALATSDARRWFGVFQLCLGLTGVIGGVLLLIVPPAGRVFLLLAAGGAYVEAALALGHFEQSWFSLVLYVGSMAAEAWVAWFLLHPRTRSYLRLRAQPAGVA